MEKREPMRYAEQNTHQCWTCKNRVGQVKYVINVMDVDSIINKIPVLLPECRVADKGMLWVNECPCPKYICSYGDRSTQNCRTKIDEVEKIGHWVDHIKDFWCSECGCRILPEQVDSFSKCPQCGVRMDEVE